MTAAESLDLSAEVNALLDGLDADDDPDGALDFFDLNDGEDWGWEP